MPTEYHRADAHVYRRIANEDLLVSLRREAVSPLYALSSTAVALWQSLGHWSTIEMMVDRLVAEFDVEREVAVADVETFIEQLLGMGALQSREQE